MPRPVRRRHGAGQGLDQRARPAAAAGDAVELASARLPPSTYSSSRYGRPSCLADVVDLDDVGMLQPGDGLGLAQEADDRLGAGVRAGQDHLQGAGRLRLEPSGQVDDAHPAPAQLAEDLVARGWRGTSAAQAPPPRGSRRRGSGRSGPARPMTRPS